MPASALTLCPHAHRAPAENQPAWSAGSSRLPGQQLLPHSLPSANALQLARPATLFLDHVSYQLPSHLSLLFAASTPQRSCSRPLPALRRPPGQLSPRPHGHQCPLPLCSSCHLPAAGPHPADHASCPRDCSDIIFFRVSSYFTPAHVGGLGIRSGLLLSTLTRGISFSLESSCAACLSMAPILFHFPSWASSLNTSPYFPLPTSLCESSRLAAQICMSKT